MVFSDAAGHSVATRLTHRGSSFGVGRTKYKPIRCITRYLATEESEPHQALPS